MGDNSPQLVNPQILENFKTAMIESYRVKRFHENDELYHYLVLKCPELFAYPRKRYTAVEVTIALQTILYNESGFRATLDSQYFLNTEITELLETDQLSLNTLAEKIQQHLFDVDLPTLHLPFDELSVTTNSTTFKLVRNQPIIPRQSFPVQFYLGKIEDLFLSNFRIM